MGNARGTALHFKNNTRLSYTLREETTSVSATATQTDHSLLGRHDRCHQQNVIPGCVKVGQIHPQFHFDHILETQKRRHTQANIQFEKPESLRENGQISVDKYPPGTRFFAEARLVGENRLTPGILSPTNLAQSSMLLATDLPRTINGDDMLALRTQFRPENFCISNKLGRTTSQRSSRSEIISVFGRLPCCPSRSQCSEAPDHVDCRRTVLPRMAHKHRKKCVHPEKDSRIFGHSVGPVDQYKISSRKTDDQNRGANTKTPRITQSGAVSVTTTHRPTQFCQFCSTTRSPALSCIANACELTFTSENIQICNAAPERTERASMVASEQQKGFDYSSPDCIPLSDHRCKRHRLGSQTGFRQPDGRMDRRRAEPSLQPQGDDCNLQRLTRSRSAPELESDSNPVRQQNCCILSPQRRRNQVRCVDEPYIQNIPNLGSQQHIHEHLSYTRQLQRPRRPAVSQTGLTGMAPAPSCDENHLREMGSPTDRSVRIPSCSRGGYILHTRSNRREGQLLRCTGHSVGLPSGVGVPTTFSNPKDASTPEQSSRDLPARSTKVGEGLLETRREEQSSSTTVHAQRSAKCVSGRDDRQPTAESIRNGNRNLEMCGWNRHLTGWTEEQKNLLSGSWRKSTLNTYKPAWNRWVAWAERNNVGVHNPNGSQLARFLADLHQKERLSLSTILLHKSVVSTFSDPNSDQKLSSNNLVKQVLKSIALAKTTSKSKPPVWDIDILAQHLSGKDPDTSSFFEVSQHTAALLLLCSGRRVHDLTLLKVSAENCIVNSDNITLWPAFGSKTDSVTHRQSGWRLLANTDNRALDPVYWISRLIVLSKTRRLAAKSDSLFLSTIGEPKPASRTVIGGWVKRLLQEVGIEASPGSFRSAVASKNWTQHLPLDEILAKGNWKSANTFQKYYCREILPAPRSTTILSSNFVPLTE